VRFLIDSQLPPALARFIDSELGCEAMHVVDVGLRDASDALVWQYASANGSSSCRR
jgi:predicted nuclease of predicted toxin-antitoxin system